MLPTDDDGQYAVKNGRLLFLIHVVILLSMVLVITPQLFPDNR
jgi:hypothetical protein